VLSADNLTAFTYRLSRTSRILNPLQPQGLVEARIGRALYDDVVCSLECIVSSGVMISK